jgi:hypothetical protein
MLWFIALTYFLEALLTIEWNNYKKFACVVRDIGLLLLDHLAVVGDR